MPDVTFRVETPGRAVVVFTLPGLPGQLTARELIRLRVREEVAKHNLAPAPGHLDWEQQAEAAERAFTRNGFIMLAGNRQVEDLDEVIRLAEDQDVVFVKLVPLAGG
jgi:hypothetical protein